MAWYEDFFHGDWLYVQRHRHPALVTAFHAEQIVKMLGLQPGAEVLDVPCGTGRVSVELAERGMAVTGVDRTPVLLEDAGVAAEKRGVKLELHERDMRDLPWEGRFDAAVNLWGSFGYFDDAGNLDFANAVCRALKPGGAFVIDCPSLEGIAQREKSWRWWTSGDVGVLEDSRYDFLTGVMHMAWTLISQGQHKVHRSAIRIYSVAELTALLRQAGFREFEAYSGFDGSPFAFGREVILIAKKQAPELGDRPSGAISAASEPAER